MGSIPIEVHCRHDTYVKMTSFVGIWKKESVTGLDSLLTALGHIDKVGKVAAIPLDTMITVDGENWSIIRNYPNHMLRYCFKLGEVIDVDTFTPGQTIRVATTFDGIALTVKSLDKDYTHVAYIEDGKLKETMTMGTASALRISRNASQLV